MTISVATWSSVALPLKKSNHFRGRNINMVILQGIRKKGKRGFYFAFNSRLCVSAVLMPLAYEGRKE